MKKALVLMLAMLAAPAIALADDVDCGEQAKTCFMDGHSTSCICVDPPSEVIEPVPFVPPEGEDPGPYEGGSGGE